MKSDRQLVIDFLNSILNMIDMGSLEELWKSVLENPVPLFNTVGDDPTLAIFNDKGFCLSKEAEQKYEPIKSKPHIYVARLESENAYYIGKSNQVGGRWKPNHAYHLGNLAYEILKTKIKERGDHDYNKWVQEWFEPFENNIYENYHAIRLKEKVIISFFFLEKKEFEEHLKNYETILMRWALKSGFIILNKAISKKLYFNIDKIMQNSIENKSYQQSIDAKKI